MAGFPAGEENLAAAVVTVSTPAGWRTGVRRGLSGNMSGALATAAAGQVVLVGSGVLAARALGVDGRGQLAAILLVPSVVGQLGTLGVPLAVTFFVARDGWGASSLVYGLRLLVGAQVLVLTVTQAGLLLLLMSPHERVAMFVSFAVMPALIGQQYGLAVLQGMRRFTRFNLLRVAPATAYVLILVILTATGRARLLEVVIAWTVANLIVGAPLAVIGIRFGLSGRGRDPRPVLPALRFGAKAVLGSTSPSELLRLDQSVVAFSLPRSALGLYVVALAFTNLPRFISQSIGMVAYPRLAAAARRSAVRELLRFYIVVVGLSAGFVVVVLEFSVAWLIPLFFGDGFKGAIDAARILLAAAYLLAIRRVLSDIAQGVGFPGTGTAAEIVNLLVAFPLIALATPRFGINGAAAALAIGAAASLSYLAVAMQRRTSRIAVHAGNGEIRGA